MGYNEAELSNIIAEYELRKKFKMTREEARKIVFDKCRQLEGKECEAFVEVLEALGLIKFDKIELVSSIRPVQWGCLKRDFDKVANDILTSRNPDVLREAIRNFKYLIEELG